MRTRLALATTTALTALLFAGACSSSPQGANPNPPTTGAPNLQVASALQPFDSCDAVLSSLKTEARNRTTAYGLQGVGGSTGDVVANAARPSAAPATTNAPSAGASEKSTADQAAGAPAPADPAHSSTNVQEAGVDEPDVIKTDGTRLFAITNGVLRSFTVTDGVPKLAGSLDVANPSGGEQQLLASGGKLLVLTKSTGPSGRSPRPDVIVDDVESTGKGSAAGTQLTEVDASDLEHLQATSQITIDGSVVDARLVGNTSHVVLSSTPANLDFVQPRSSTGKSQQAAKDANRRIIDASTADDWLPQYSIAGSDEHRPLVECANVRHPATFGGFGMVTVLTVELGQGINPRNSVAIQADADKVYATKDRLFVTTNRPPDATGDSNGATTGSTTGTARPTGAPTPTRAGGGIACDPACPRPSEPIAPTTTPKTTPDSDAGYRTAVHEFDITGSGPAGYRASGDVRGHVMNDFSLSSRDGFLRIATTDGAPFVGSSQSNRESFVTVLQEQDGELRQVGQVGGMGKGEQIKSVRFIGSTGYVVTFRQTDPLYTVDLSDPRQPRVAGELKILGYSAYLHPVSDKLLLGVGQDATSTGRTTGTQVALFDVSNPSAPAQLQKIALPNARSDAEQDYHAFLYWDPTHLAMIPVQSFGSRGSAPSCPPDADCATSKVAAPTDSFVGAVGFTVDANGIKELGRIVNPLPTGGSTSGPTSGPTVITEPPGIPSTTTTFTLPTDPAVLAACRAAGQCPPESPEGGRPPTTTVPPARSNVGAPIERAIVIGDRVLTLSANGLQVSQLDTLSPVTFVAF